jgi:hypothetical protein
MVPCIFLLSGCCLHSGGSKIVNCNKISFTLSRIYFCRFSGFCGRECWDHGLLSCETV